MGGGGTSKETDYSQINQNQLPSLSIKKISFFGTPAELTLSSFDKLSRRVRESENIDCLIEMGMVVWTEINGSFDRNMKK